MSANGRAGQHDDVALHDLLLDEQTDFARSVSNLTGPSLLLAIWPDHDQAGDIAFVGGHKAYRDFDLYTKFAFHSRVRLDPERLLLGRLAEYAAGDCDPLGGKLNNGSREGIVVMRFSAGTGDSGRLVGRRILRHGHGHKDQARFDKLPPHN